MSAAAAVLLNHSAAEQGVTAMWTAISQQHATDMCLIAVPPKCHLLGQLSATLLGSTLMTSVCCRTRALCVSLFEKGRIQRVALAGKQDIGVSVCVCLLLLAGP